MEAYVDQSAKRAAFNARIAGVAALARRDHRGRLRPAGARLHLAHAAEAAGGLARRVPRPARPADRDPQPRPLHARSRRGDRARLRGRRARRSTSTASRTSTTRTGQAAGDDILRQMARRLQTLSRQAEPAGAARRRRIRAGRDRAQPAPGHADRAARSSPCSARRFTLATARSRPRVCVGSAVAPAHGTDAAGLLKNAEIALFHAKSEGRGTRSLFRPEMDAELQARRDA